MHALHCTAVEHRRAMHRPGPPAQEGSPAIEWGRVRPSLPQALQWLTQSLSQPHQPAVQSVGELVAMLTNRGDAHGATSAAAQQQEHLPPRAHEGLAPSPAHAPMRSRQLEPPHEQQLRAPHAEQPPQPHSALPLSQLAKETVPEGSVTVLVSCLKSPDPAVQRLSAAALSWLAGDEHIRTLIAAEGAVPAMMELLNTGSASVQREAALGLRQLAADQHIRARIVHEGGVPALLDLLDATDTQTQMLTALALNWIVEDARVRRSLVEQGGIGKLVRLLKSESVGVQREAASTITQLAADPEIRPLVAQVRARSRARDGRGRTRTRARLRRAWHVSAPAGGRARR